MAIDTKTASRITPRIQHPWHVYKLVVMLLAIALSLLPYYLLTAPDSAALSDSPSARQAMQTIALLSQSTRSVGDAYHDTARDWLAAELRGMGLEVQTQEVVVEGQPVPLVNVMGRLAARIHAAMPCC